MENDSDDEVFFGTPSSKEMEIAAKFCGRKTEIYSQAPLFQRRSSASSLGSHKEEGKNSEDDSASSLIVHAQDVSNTLSDMEGQLSRDSKLGDSLSSSFQDGAHDSKNSSLTRRSHSAVGNGTSLLDGSSAETHAVNGESTSADQASEHSEKEEALFVFSSSSKRKVDKAKQSHENIQQVPSENESLVSGDDSLYPNSSGNDSAFSCTSYSSMGTTQSALSNAKHATLQEAYSGCDEKFVSMDLESLPVDRKETAENDFTVDDKNLVKQSAETFSGSDHIIVNVELESLSVERKEMEKNDLTVDEQNLVEKSAEVSYSQTSTAGEVDSEEQNIKTLSTLECRASETLQTHEVDRPFDDPVFESQIGGSGYESPRVMPYSTDNTTNLPLNISLKNCISDAFWGFSSTVTQSPADICTDEQISGSSDSLHKLEMSSGTLQVCHEGPDKSTTAEASLLDKLKLMNLTAFQDVKEMEVEMPTNEISEFAADGIYTSQNDLIEGKEELPNYESFIDEERYERNIGTDSLMTINIQEAVQDLKLQALLRTDDEHEEAALQPSATIDVKCSEGTEKGVELQSRDDGIPQDLECDEKLHMKMDLNYYASMEHIDSNSIKGEITENTVGDDDDNELDYEPSCMTECFSNFQALPNDSHGYIEENKDPGCQSEYLFRDGFFSPNMQNTSPTIEKGDCSEMKDTNFNQCVTVPTTSQDYSEASVTDGKISGVVPLTSDSVVTQVSSQSSSDNHHDRDDLVATVSCSSSYNSGGLSHNYEGSSAESYGTLNRGNVFSQISLVSSSSSSSSCAHGSGSLQTNGQSFGEEGSSGPQSLESETEEGLPHPTEEALDSSRDSSGGSESPSFRFNDTIEEMEMMLKYGLNYGDQMKEQSDDNNQHKNVCGTEKTEHDIARDDHNIQVNRKEDNVIDSEDESIVGSRKSSVASTVSNFQPTLDSTRASSSVGGTAETEVIVLDAVKQQSRSISNQAASCTEVRKEPPPKPPRNVYSPAPSPVKGEPSVKVSQVSKATDEVSISIKKSQIGRQVHPTPRSITPKPYTGTKAKCATPNSAPNRISTQAPSNLRTPGTVLDMKQTPNSMSRLGRKPTRPGRLFAGSGLPSQVYVESKSQQVTPKLKVTTPLNKKLDLHHDKSLTKMSRPPRPTPSKLGTKSVLKHPSGPDVKLTTPRGTSIRSLLKTHTENKHISPAVQQIKLKHGLSIVSPVAKYLKENPPPSLVVNVKPRNKISPVKTFNSKDITEKQNLPFKSSAKHNNSSGTEERDLTSPHENKFQARVQGELKNHTFRMNVHNSQVGEDDRDLKDDGSGPRIKQVLPKAIYRSAVPILMDETDNKENERARRREILSDKCPTYVVKHRGRMKVPKTSQGDPVSPKGYKSPTHQVKKESAMRNQSSGRGSLMEVSIYEPHVTEYTHTLHKNLP